MNQPEGLGDILYTQKIGYHFSSLGYDIYWPANSAYSSTINDYLPSFKYFNNSLDGFLSVGLSEKIYNLFLEYPGQRGEIFDGQVDDLSLKIVPTNHLQDIQALDPSIMPVSPYSFMSKKYAFVGVSDHDWFDYLYISRNLKKELDLYHEVLHLNKEQLVHLFSDRLSDPFRRDNQRGYWSIGWRKAVRMRIEPQAKVCLTQRLNDLLDAIFERLIVDL